MKKMYRYLAIFGFSICSIIFPCLILIFTGTATPFIHCFAVDASDRLYIGTDSDIYVYDNGIMIGTINPHTSRGYMFTINEEQLIVLSTASKVHLMDLNGTILQTHDDPGAYMYNQIQYKKRTFVSANGDEYKLIGEFGWTRIIKNRSELIYQISVLSFMVKVLIAVAAVALFLFGFWAAKYAKRSV